MALSSIRMEYRIALSHIDKGLELNQTVVTALHPSETPEHLTLRLLAWCLLQEEHLAFGPGLSDPEAADLWTHDLTGRLTTWIECGTVSAEKLRWVVQHHPGAAVHAVFAGKRRREELLAEVAGWKRATKGFDQIHLWTVDSALVDALASRAKEGRRHRWSVTLVGDHFYIETEGANLDGEAARSAPV